MATRMLLGLLGMIYVVLAIWCAAMPDETARSVGFILQPGSGQSEFVTVYGGFELALGLVFLWPMVRPEATAGSLRLCLLMHACLVFFRTLSFGLYEGIPSTTKYFAMFEWTIFLAALVAVLRSRHRGK